VLPALSVELAQSLVYAGLIKGQIGPAPFQLDYLRVQLHPQRLTEAADQKELFLWWQLLSLLEQLI